MRKSKLDKLIEKNNENKTELNYSVLDKAIDEVSERNKHQKANKRFEWKTLSKILVPLCCVIVIIVVAVVMFYPTGSSVDDIPPTLEVPKPNEKPIPEEKPSEGGNKHYAGSEKNQRNIQSIEVYNKEKDLALRYFELADSEELYIVFEDEENEKDKDVLLWQRILLIETYEEIKMYIELQDNYTFDILDRFGKLENEREVKGINVKYDTFFDEDQYLFCTRTTFELDGFKYNIEFLLEDEEQWESYLMEIL